MSETKNINEDKTPSSEVERVGVRFIIAGGGTGGHIFPAIAIANAIKELKPKLKYCLLAQKEKWKWKKCRRAVIRLKDWI